MTPTRRDVPSEQPDPSRDRDPGHRADPDPEHEPATVPAHPTGVWGQSDRERRDELDRFHQHRTVAARISLPVRLGMALVFLLSAAVVVWLTVLALR